MARRKRKDFTSAGGTAAFRSGRPWRQAEKKVNVLVHLDNFIDQGVLSQHLTNKTGWSHKDRLYEGKVHTIILNTTVADIERTLATLGIFAKSVEEYHED
jgi:hypothetical protein